MNNSVFISYRRNVSSYIARAIFQDLRANSIDAFMDVESIDSGEFDTVLLHQIAARPYFLIILTPGTLDRCVEPEDWLLQELQHAIRLKRVVIPLLTPTFSFDDAAKFLPDGLAIKLTHFNAVSVPHEYFEAAMERLRTRFLKPIDLPLMPIPKAAVPRLQQKMAQVEAAPPVTEDQLSAQGYFERAWKRGESDWDGQIADYSLAIRLNPEYVDAYINRCHAYLQKQDLDNAIADANEAIRLKPDEPLAYINRAIARGDKGDLDGEIADYSTAIQFSPRLAVPYLNRGEGYFVQGKYDRAFADFQKVIELNEYIKNAIAGQALVYHTLGQVHEAKRKWQSLLMRDKRFRDADWVGKELNWAEPLIEETRKLIAEL